MTKKRLVCIVLVLLGLYLAWRWWRGHDAAALDDHGSRILVDRLWVERMPKEPTDSVHLFALVSKRALGVFDRRSTWKGEWELFRFERRGDGQLDLLFPQSRDKRRVTYRAWKCAERDFDFCLEMSGGRDGVRRYYSQRGWELHDLDAATLPAAAARLLPQP